MNHKERYEYRPKAYQWALAADAEWSRLLRAQFGKNSGDIRYQPAGKGTPGSLLRRAHDEFQSSDKLWLDLVNCRDCYPGVTSSIEDLRR